MTPVKDAVDIYFPNGKHVSGRIEITETEVIIYKQSMAVTALFVMFFGAIANARFNGKEILRFSLSDIISGKRETHTGNKCSYRITLKNGKTYVMLFANPEKIIDYFTEIIKKAY